MHSSTHLLALSGPQAEEMEGRPRSQPDDLINFRQLRSNAMQAAELDIYDGDDIRFGRSFVRSLLFFFDVGLFFFFVLCVIFLSLMFWSLLLLLLFDIILTLAYHHQNLAHGLNSFQGVFVYIHSEVKVTSNVCVFCTSYVCFCFAARLREWTRPTRVG